MSKERRKATIIFKRELIRHDEMGKPIHGPIMLDTIITPWDKVQERIKILRSWKYQVASTQRYASLTEDDMTNDIGTIVDDLKFE
ncbi:hypothetical protein ACK8P5_25960 (plasmid) [Paenibacillus sp. EC2-1]|uniref:hypothetical protein n=1 Tax=Paenibacillus sp. EC2-1 TaxID=3388665 RepID=UPI003BEEF970